MQDLNFDHDLIFREVASFYAFRTVDLDIKNILSSVKILIESNLDYEFRTTVAPGMTKKDILAIAKKIKNAKKYFLQEFKDTEIINNS